MVECKACHYYHLDEMECIVCPSCDAEVEEEPTVHVYPFVSLCCWTRESACDFIALLHPEAFKHGYNLHLGGGVLCRGYSQKDLDIVAVRRPQVLTPDIAPVLMECARLGYTLEQPAQKMPFRRVYKKLQHPTGLQIDLIVLDLANGEEQHKAYYRDKEDQWSKNHLAELLEIRQSTLNKLTSS